MPLTRYGFRECLLITAASAAGAIMAIFFALWWLLGPIIVIWLALLAFFRDPIRSQPAELGPDDAISPADGTISAVERVDHHEATDGPAVIVRIFLSIFNVHVNRIPVDGEVVDLIYRPGEFLDARSEESARVNESNLIVMKTVHGEQIGVRQVSGAVARRIVCDLERAQRVHRGAKFGMIKFGSTTELILPRPQDVTVHVKKGDRVKGGLTVLATLPAPNGETASESASASASATPDTSATGG